MTTTLISPVRSEDKKSRAPSNGFAGREMLEPLLHPSGTVHKLRENLLSCSSPDFDLSSFTDSITAAGSTRISGGPAMVLETGSGPFLLYKEPYEGFHLIVSGLLGLKPGDARILKKQNGDTMYLSQVTEEKRSALDIRQI
jgi:hypothetical protein